MNHDVHLGVTGLRRTGKTVFLTALIYHLRQLGTKELPALSSQEITFKAAQLIEGDQKRRTRVASSLGAMGARLGIVSDNGACLEDFPYVSNLRPLRESSPRFPPATDREYHCTLRFHYEKPKPDGILHGIKDRIGLGRSYGTITLHLHDYPGEFLLDVRLNRQNYEKWSDDTIERMQVQCPADADHYLRVADEVRNASPDEIVEALRVAYAQYAWNARKRGMEYVQPGMTLPKWFQEAEKLGKPPHPTADDLPFVPLPKPLASNDSLKREMSARYQDHVKHRVQPFVNRLQKCSMQLVLVDVLRVLRNGLAVYNDTEECVAAILKVYHDCWRPFGGIKRVLFAATKADHAPKDNRANMTKLLNDLVFAAEGNIKKRVRRLPSEWFTSLRATQDGLKQCDDRPLNVLCGVKKGSQDGPKNQFPGFVPDQWPAGDDWVFENKMYDFPEFEPRQIPKRNGASWPHMNLDRVIWRILEPYIS